MILTLYIIDYKFSSIKFYKFCKVLSTQVNKNTNNYIHKVKILDT